MNLVIGASKIVKLVTKLLGVLTKEFAQKMARGQDLQ